jgi:serine protease inhibitor
MQTDDTIILINKWFLARGKKKLKQVKYTVKPKEKLIVVNLLLFNGCVLSFQGNQMILCQKD